MGYYIEIPGQVRGKALAIIELHGGRRILHAPASLCQLEDNEALVCVVHNQFFEVAVFCYNEKKVTEFASPDGRAKEWLVMDRAKACELSGYKA